MLSFETLRREFATKIDKQYKGKWTDLMVKKNTEVRLDKRYLLTSKTPALMWRLCTSTDLLLNLTGLEREHLW